MNRTTDLPRLIYILYRKVAKLNLYTSLCGFSHAKVLNELQEIKQQLTQIENYLIAKK